MVIVDENGLIQTVNDKLESEIGYTKEELINQPIKIILPKLTLLRMIYQVKPIPFTTT